MFAKLFKPKAEPVRQYVVAQLNSKIMPLERGELFEDPLDKFLKEWDIGEVSGGGTQQAETGEIQHCDIEIECKVMTEELFNVVMSTLEELGAPKGSLLRIPDQYRKIPFGTSEGLAVYLNGTDLPQETYRDCDSNHVIEEFDRLLGAGGKVLNWWQGPTETALYVYGESFATMHERLAPFIASYPLCQQCRIVRIA